MRGIVANVDNSNVDKPKPAAVYAAGIQFAYKTKFGPMMANVHWNSSTNRVGVYLGVGFDF
jgi:hypothetical protein